MGSGNFRWKVLFVVVVIVVLWQIPKVWLISDVKEYLTEVQSQKDITSYDLDSLHEKQKIHIAVYYEALCPDSRSFFVKQLVPMYYKIPTDVNIELIPYGKATTKKTVDSYEFVCQHGPVECQANIIHACAIDFIKDPETRLDYVSCMIKNNFEPVDIMDFCARKFNVDYNPIYECYSGTRGKELLAKYGEMTTGLVPPVSFIPTVTLDGSAKDQAEILKNLLHQVCLRFKSIPKGCV